MPEIRAIHGLRYDLGHIGSLAEVISPPTAEISPEQRDKLYQRHPANVVRVLTNREEVGDDDSSNRFTRAARFITDWQRQGVLQKDPDPAIYVYHQEFDFQGQSVIRRGFLAGAVLPEQDLSDNYEDAISALDPKNGHLDFFGIKTNPLDALQMLRATHTNVEPAVSIYSDSKRNVQQILENCVATMTPLVAKDEFGVTHRLWPVTDHMVIGEVREAMANCPDRYCYELPHSIAQFYRHELKQVSDLPSNHPAHSVLTAFFELNEPGFACRTQLPLYLNAPQLTSSELTEKLGAYFDTFSYGQGVEIGTQLWDELTELGEFGHFGLYCAADDQWVIASLTEEGMLRMDELYSDRPEAWRYLDRSILEWLIMLDLLETAEPRSTYVEDVESLIKRIRSEDFPEYSMAAIVLPTQPSQLEPLWQPGNPVSEKLLTDPQPVCGLVFNPLK
ncbi:DUF1015 family protein [Blastopirellula marina]|uniref:DUF1015 domain-containing protein n=1 Tax=Blastopirellula marina TaxID=124 RepID=A0A2S8FPA0_9BACT|nr:DUF1015 domain-containing protein [Blastopirellula marina]PQO34013.1 hypothetical protein C5Y98_17530 [Blastopirellula marina]PTL43799.1 hypothetical protein C5Y97_17540 [Blastopirellula marina]